MPISGWSGTQRDEPILIVGVLFPRPLRGQQVGGGRGELDPLGCRPVAGGDGFRIRAAEEAAGVGPAAEADSSEKPIGGGNGGAVVLDGEAGRQEDVERGADDQRFARIAVEGMPNRRRRGDNRRGGSGAESAEGGGGDDRIVPGLEVGPGRADRGLVFDGEDLDFEFLGHSGLLVPSLVEHGQGGKAFFPVFIFHLLRGDPGVSFFTRRPVGRMSLSDGFCNFCCRRAGRMARRHRRSGWPAPVTGTRSMAK